MEDKRSSLFTVKDAENTILWFCIHVVVLIAIVISHQFFLKNYNFVDSIYFIFDNISKIVAASTLLIIFGEGIDIMLRRFREYLRREKEFIEKGKDQVYREIEEWQRRKTEAESRGEQFTEPPPQRPQPSTQAQPKE